MKNAFILFMFISSILSVTAYSTQEPLRFTRNGMTTNPAANGTAYNKLAWANDGEPITVITYEDSGNQQDSQMVDIWIKLLGDTNWTHVGTTVNPVVGGAKEFFDLEQYVYADSFRVTHVGGSNQNSFWLEIQENATFPIEITLFEGKAEKNGTNTFLLITASEVNAYKIYLEATTDGLHFTTVDNRNAHGTTTEESRYYLSDTDPKEKTYYRIKQVDFNGDVMYSNMIEVINVNTGSHPKMRTLRINVLGQETP